MGVLKTLLSVKAAEKIAEYIDSKNRMPPGTGQYIPRRKAVPTARTAALASVATSMVRRNPKLLLTAGAAGAAVFLASYLVKRKQQKPTYY